MAATREYGRKALDNAELDGLTERSEAHGTTSTAMPLRPFPDGLICPSSARREIGIQCGVVSSVV